MHAWRLFRVVRADLQIDVGIVRRAIGVDVTWKAMHRPAIVPIVQRLHRQWIAFVDDELKNEIENSHGRGEILPLHFECIQNHFK